MSGEPREVGARPLSATRWAIDLDTGSAGLAPERVRLFPLGTGTPGATLEVLTPAPPGAAAQAGAWTAILALDAAPDAHGAVAEYDVRGAGWPRRVRLATGLGTAGDQEPAAAALAAVVEPRADLDYTARDFTALRALLLGVIARETGAGAEDPPAAETTAIVELLAYLGDALSYRQDAVATEAYLETARRRVSVARHAELLDYHVFDGASARTWARFTVAGDRPIRLLARSVVLSGAGQGLPARCTSAEAQAAILAGALIFETLADAELLPETAPLALDPDAHPGSRLLPGATEAVVVGDVPEDVAPGALVLLEAAGGAGHVVRLDAVAPSGGATTLLRWRAADALPDDPAWAAGGVQVIARNLVLVEHGQTLPWEMLPPTPATGLVWPALAHPQTTLTRGLGRLDAARSAHDALAAAERRARPAVEVRERDGDGQRTHAWRVCDSLLQSGPFDRDLVVELDDEGVAHLRFGDGANGMRPAPEMVLEARQRVGGGMAGNVPAGTLRHLVGAAAGVVAVRQPMAARGGAVPETLDAVRLAAPDAYHRNERAVTAEDYRAQALAVAGVRDAQAALDWTGAWPVAAVAVHTGGWPVDAAVLDRVRRHLRARMPAGVALTVSGARALAATIELEVLVDAGWTPAAVGGDVDAALRADLLAADRFGFATTLYRSQVVTAVGAVPGVADVLVRRFGWTATATADGPPLDALVPPAGAIIRIADDPLAPELGAIAYRLATASRA